MTRCSVVIVSYQSGPILFATLKRVLAQEGLAEVLLVDNGNAPHTLSRLQQMALGDGRLKIVSGQGNVGIAKACNLGAGKAVGEYLLFLHPDCLMGPGAIKGSVGALEGDRDAMVAGAWLLRADGSEEMTAHAVMSEVRTGFRHLLRFGYHYQPTSFIPGSAFEVPSVSGVFLCISAANFRVLGGFDEGFFLTVEDADLCRRVRNAGKKVVKLPQVQAVHLHNTSATLLASAISWQNAKGWIRFYKKHDRKTLFPGARWGINGMLLANYAYVQGMRKLGLFKARGHNLRARLVHFLAMGLVDLTQADVLRERQVLVTGATGQIGVNVLRRLVAEGASVVALTRQEPLPFLHERVWWVKGDLADVNFDLPDFRLDAVVHCAPLKHLPQHLKRLAGMGVSRVVAFGTTALFSQASSKNWHEKEMVDHLRAAEAAVEEICAQAGMRWTILRPTLAYGMGMDNGITKIERFVKRFGFFPVYPPAQGKRHPVHVDDLAKAGIMVLDNAGTYDKAYNLSGADVMTFREMVERIFVSCKRSKRVVETTLLPFGLDVGGKLLHKKEINAEIAYRMNDDLIFFHDAARADFGFSPRGFLRGEE